jgi:phosphatidate cytidylyltransferase
MKDLNMLKRFAMALVIIPPVGLLIIFGPSYTLSLMVCAAAILGLYEFYAMTMPQGGIGEKIGGIVLSIILCGLFQWAPAEGIILFLGAIMVFLFLGYAFSSEELSILPNRIGIIFLGIIYIPFLLSHVTLIKKLPQGILWVLLLLATVWVGDTFALVIGSWWGRHKLSPRISPHKTIEGFFACFVGAILTVFAFKALFLPTVQATDAVFVGLGIALFGQLGDLSESMIKRGAKVKDSGSLIPGHGGVLDRLDSFFFAAPFLYYFLIYKIFTEIS